MCGGRERCGNEDVRMATYGLIMLFANLLARKLAHPVIAAAGGSVFRHEAWDDERHFVC